MRGFNKAIRALIFCYLFMPGAWATELHWNSGFMGFIPGDVYFAATVAFSNMGEDRGTTLFRYSPKSEEIHEVMRLIGTGNSRHIVYDPISGGLYIADTSRIQFLSANGKLTEVQTALSGIIDLAIDPDGKRY